MANFTLGITGDGLALLTKAMAGKTLTFTGVQLGSGSYSGSVSAATGLVAPEVTLPITSMVHRADSATIKAVLEYRELESGFTWTEVGVLAKDPDTQENVLYAYGYAGSQGDYIPGASEATLNEKTIQLTTLVSETADIDAVIQSSLYVSHEELEELEIIIQQITGVDPSDPTAEPSSVSTVATLTHIKNGTVHAFTGLGSRTGLVPCQFKATAAYTEGDTATIDGTAYTIVLTSDDDPEDGLFTYGRSVLVDVDTAGKTINFKAGGGLTKAKLALATATEATVFSGKTFYAGDSKELRTGTALSTVTDVAAGNLFNGRKAYDNNGNLITGTALSQAVNVTANNIPSGVTAYNQAGQRITGNGSGVFKYKSGSCFLNGSSKSISCDFHIWMVALYGGSWLSDCVLFTGTSNSGSTTFYKCPDSDFIDQENYQGTISVSGGNYATIWYNAGDGCSIYYYVVGV